MRILDTSRASYDKSADDGCYFCNREVIEKQECTKFSFRHWMVLVNKHPYLNGNLMLIPIRHVTALEELSESEWGEFSGALLAVRSVLGDMFQTDSFNVGINVGEESGRSVPHLHWQIIPRKRKNHTVVGVLADLHVITVAPEALKRDLSKETHPLVGEGV